MSTRDTATRLLVARVIRDRLTEADRALRDQARVDFDQPGVRDIGVIDGEQIGSVQLTKGRQSWRVSDSAALLAWVQATRPDEVVSVPTVRGSYVTALLAAAKQNGAPVDPTTGEVIPGIASVEGDPTLTVKPSDDAPDVIARAMQDGSLTWADVATAAIEGGAA